MKTAPKLQEIVTQIARKHGVDLTKVGAYLRLELTEHGHLVIENIGAGRVSVTNYIEVNRNWMADPQVVLYTMLRPAPEASGQTPSIWIPLECTDFFEGWRLYAELDAQDGLALYDPTGQAELARFSDKVLAPNLQRDGWLEQAVRAPVPLRVWSDEEIRARDIRIDELLATEEEAGDGS
jgi:hypothetical protein